MQLIDSYNRIIELKSPAKRIVSLIPSLTETLFSIGAGQQIVGVSNFCTQPPERVGNLPKVGGQKNPDCEKIAKLNPDLLLLNREENRRDDYERLAAQYPVYVSDIRRVTDVPDLIFDLGRLTGQECAANELALRIQRTLNHTAQNHLLKHCTRVVTLIWHKPLMTANGDTYLSDWLRRAGAANVFHDFADRYPTITAAQIADAQPQAILFPTEPHPWHENEIANAMNEIEKAGCRARAIAIDGSAITWYGARTLTSLEHELPGLIRRLDEEAAE